MTISISSSHAVVLAFMIICIFLSNTYGDSEKKTAWMFFLYPLGILVYVLYWIVNLFIYIIK